MQLTKLANQIINDFSEYTFVKGHDFRWSHAQATIFYPQLTTSEHIASLLHEIGHAELGHSDYSLDITLVSQEAQAWQYACTNLAPHYGLHIADDYVQDHLDTYREWLYARSTCPDCSHNGLQTKNTYSCINCGCSWRANAALFCELRRTKLVRL